MDLGTPSVGPAMLVYTAMWLSTQSGCCEDTQDMKQRKTVSPHEWDTTKTCTFAPEPDCPLVIGEGEDTQRTEETHDPRLILPRAHEPMMREMNAALVLCTPSQQPSFEIVVA